ncbi:class I SAM-dependent methyltransferase [Pseudomonas sp. NPDC087803]|uniref:class I SAM-dependent methyltransferase n=1 Tax=Pseudomonas sp. NPDC087803 TaxID=3364448 RepID=UPI003802C936
MDWQSWHENYRSFSPLQLRLEEVCQQVTEAINAVAPSRVQVLSLCAGDGRDLLKALQSGHTSKEVDATLIELDPGLVEQGRKAFAEHGLSDSVQFRCADATSFATYQGLPKADIVMVCGVFGNVRGPHVQQLIFSLKAFCRQGARVIWTRSLNEFDDGETAAQEIRGWFAQAGFQETVFTRTPEGTFAVSSVAYGAEQTPLPSTGRMFEFSAFWEVH